MTYKPGWKGGRWSAICTKCEIEKDISCFILRSDSGDFRRQYRECINIRAKEIRNREHYLEYSEKYRAENYDKCLAASRKWRRENLEYDAFRAATYRARKSNQTPQWADLDKIKEIYLNCPEGHHVDHIIPLKGKLVKGLHVENNLQYLPARENLAKRNIYHDV